MRAAAAALLMVFATAIPLAAQTPDDSALSRGKYEFADSTLYWEAVELRAHRPNEIVLAGKAYLKLVSKSGTTLEARSAEIKIELGQMQRTGKAARTDVKSAVFTGPVRVSQTKTKSVTDTSGKASKVTTRLDADAKSARYEGDTQTAYLTGSVKMTQTDPSAYDQPVVATAETAQINLKQDLDPEELLVRLDTPGGLSRIEFALKSPAGAPPGDGTSVLTAAQIERYADGRQILSGGAYVKLIDRAAGTEFESRAAKITAVQFPSKSKTAASEASDEAAAFGLSGFASIKSVDFEGPVHITSIRPKQVRQKTGGPTIAMTRMDADSDSAHYDGETQTAHLTGNARMSQTDPAVHDAPITASGHEAEVSMKANPEPDELVLRINTPGGLSRIEFTRKPDAKASDQESSVFSAAKIERFGSGRQILDGSAHVRLFDEKTGSTFESNAEKITAVPFPTGAESPASARASALSSFKSIEFVGPVHFTQRKPKPAEDKSGGSVIVEITADAKSARYDGEKQMAYLTGNARVTQMDPSAYDAPLVATGHEVEFSAKPNPGPEDLVLGISTPGGLSRVEYTPKSPDPAASGEGTSVASAVTIERYGNGKQVLSGSAYARLVDRDTGTVFESRAEKIVAVEFERMPKAAAPAAPAADGKSAPVHSGLAGVKSVDFTGPVHITYITPRQVKDAAGARTSVMTKVDADSDSARYDGAAQMAHLTGNVRISQVDPTLWTAPTVVVAKEAQFSLKPNPGPNDLVFRINTPGGASHIEISPKPKEETAAK